MTNAGGISESLRQHRHMQEMVGTEEEHCASKMARC